MNIDQLKESINEVKGQEGPYLDKKAIEMICNKLDKKAKKDFLKNGLKNNKVIYQEMKLGTFLAVLEAISDI